MAAESTQTRSLPRLIFAKSKVYSRAALARYKRLNLYSKLFVWGTICLYISLATFVLYLGPERIGQALYDTAQKVSHFPYGWLLLTAAFFVISFPPAVGHTTLITLSGYAYGMKGFPIAAAGSLFGSAVTFIVLRLVFARRLRKWSESNEKWQALETVIAAKGLPLIMLIRASPFPPWVYSNALFASIHSVALWQFFLATFVIFPKIAVFVFVGSRLASLSDGKQRSHMDTTTKILNISISVGGVIIVGIASWVIYRLMKKEILHLHGIPPEIDELATEAIGEAEEGAPLLGHHNESRASLLEM